MAEYIKRIDATKAVNKQNAFTMTRVALIDSLNSIPAADVAPVVHGRWEWLGPNSLVTDCMCGTCSACKARSKYIVNTMLCPNCGAKMDGGAENAVD